MMPVLASVRSHPARRPAVGPQGPVLFLTAVSPPRTHSIRKRRQRSTLWEGDMRDKVSVTHCHLPPHRAVTEDQRGEVAGSSSHSELDSQPVPSSRSTMAPKA